MKRKINYLFITIFFSFIFIINTYAECSYQERKQLLNEAKAIDVSFEVASKEVELSGINPDTGEEQIYKKNKYYFKMNIVGMSSNLFAIITNDYNDTKITVSYEDFVDGVYTLDIENTTDLIKYTVSFYSMNVNCYMDEVINKRVTKPIENPVFFFEVCTNEKVSNNKYCNQFIDKELDKNVYQIVTELNNIVRQAESVEQIEPNIFVSILNFIKTYWYYVLTLILALIVGIVTFVIRKKRSRL